MAGSSICPSCHQLKRSAATSVDGLCDTCAGRGQPSLPGMDRTETRAPRPRTGRDLRDRALDRVEDHAGEVWNLRADEVLRAVCLWRTEFTSDDLHAHAERVGLSPPPDNRAWGPVMMRGKRIGWCVKSGAYRESKRAVCHAAPKPVYRSLIYGKGR